MLGWIEYDTNAREYKRAKIKKLGIVCESKEQLEHEQAKASNMREKQAGKEVMQSKSK